MSSTVRLVTAHSSSPDMADPRWQDGTHHVPQGTLLLLVFIRLETFLQASEFSFKSQVFPPNELPVHSIWVPFVVSLSSTIVRIKVIF